MQQSSLCAKLHYFYPLYNFITIYINVLFTYNAHISGVEAVTLVFTLPSRDMYLKVDYCTRTS